MIIQAQYKNAKLILILFSIVIFSFYNLTNIFNILDPKHDESDDATWQAGENNLQHPALQRNIDHNLNRINHYVFLTGQDRNGPIGSVYTGTACFGDLSSKFYILIQILV